MLACRVLKEVHPDVGISKQGMQVMQTFATDMFDRIMVEASRLCRISKKATLSSREIQTAGMHANFVVSFRHSYTHEWILVEVSRLCHVSKILSSSYHVKVRDSDCRYARQLCSELQTHLLT